MIKTRILLMIDDATLGGGQMHVFLLAKYLDKSQFEVSIATESQGWLFDTASALNIPLHQLNISNKITWKSFKNVQELLIKNHFDIIHTHGGTAGFWGRLVGKISSKSSKIIHTYHGLHYLNQNSIKSKIFKLIDQLLLLITNQIICVCKADYVSGLAAKVVAPNAYTIIYNGIEIDKFSSNLDQQKARKIFNIEPEKIIFGNVARLHPQKGHKILLQALAKIVNSYTNTHLLIVGDGEIREELIKIAQELGIKNHVSFLGARSDIYEFLSAIDIFVLPSLWEGQPIALLEALAMGKPCIASNVNGIPEIINNGINGYLVNPNDVDNLYELMTSLILDKQKFEQFSVNGKITVSDMFSAQNMADKTAQVYTNLLINN
ncbi:glycosyltransferase family 4 protein [Okeanomitos corallinicola TIOX110]|uniref:Glycosyltransferase family 4 protein n=1 Tax=Okeanomitos corallinicola TIOX110 TaxID=3133117 RepID=A0ABZ2UVC5_9CYAN